jgi:hypothetical protein
MGILKTRNKMKEIECIMRVGEEINIEIEVIKKTIQ